MQAPGTDKQRKYEIAAVLLTATGKFIFMDFLQWKLLLLYFQPIALSVNVNQVYF